MVTIEDFNSLNIVIGKIIEIERLPKSDKLFKIIVDLGTGKNQIIAGGADIYSPDDLIGKQVVVLANLEPKVIRGTESKGMLLAADVKGKPIWLTVDEDVPLGTRVR
jgi:methionine--tRNA ligase beta chain